MGKILKFPSLDQYLAGLEASIRAAQRLNCKTLISQVGGALPGISRADQHASLVEGLREAAHAATGEPLHI